MEIKGLDVGISNEGVNNLNLDMVDVCNCNLKSSSPISRSEIEDKPCFDFKYYKEQICDKNAKKLLLIYL